MMFTMTTKKEDSHKSPKQSHSKKHNTPRAPTIEDIQKKFDEQSFKHSMSEQWADVKKKDIFVPSEISVLVVSGEPPYMVSKEESFKVTYLQRLFLLFDQPEHCFLGEVISFFTMVVIVISCVGYIASTGAKVSPDTCDNPACENDPDLCPNSMICPPEESPVFDIIETACISFFSLDYFIRVSLVALLPARLAGTLPSYFDHLNSNGLMPPPVYSTPVSIWRYITIPMNVIDLVAILPFYVAYFSTSGGSVSIIRILRLVRVLRVFKIGGMGNGMTLMGNAMMNSLSAMGILLFFTVLGVILFGSIIFFFEAGNFEVNDEYPEGAFLRWNVLGENREESPFSSILISCYWAMVTFTTVGYGDLVPTSPLGRFVSLVLMYTGILVLALPISVIGANFQREYERLEGGGDDDFDVDDTKENDLTLWDIANNEKETINSSKRSAPPRRGLSRTMSSSSLPKNLDSQIERMVKSSIRRERRSSNASNSTIAEADLQNSSSEQLKALTSTCVKMMKRINVLHKQQVQMLRLLSPNNGNVTSDTDDIIDDGEALWDENMSSNGIELNIVKDPFLVDGEDSDITE